MEKFTMEDYKARLQSKKQDAHNKEWLYIEVNAKDLIEEYEAADGQNSFVHSVVQKEMYAWEKVDKI